MFAAKRAKGFARFITDEEPHKRAIRAMISSGVYEFELVEDSIGDMIAVNFFVAEKSLSVEKDALFTEFYGNYWGFVEEARKGILK